MAAHLVEQDTLLVLRERAEATGAPPFDVLQRGDRLIIGLDAALQHRAFDQRAQVARRQSFRRKGGPVPSRSFARGIITALAGLLAR